MNLLHIIEDLKREYVYAEQHMALNSHGPHPIKNCDVLSTYPNGTASVYTNSMYARLSDGSFGTKLIYVNEETGFSGGRVVAYHKSGTLKADMDCGILTQIRCGLMAALCLEYFIEKQDQPPNILIVGTGKLGSGIYSVIKDYGNIYARNTSGFVALPNQDKRVPSDGFDVVITATTASEKEELVTLDDYPRANLFISFDGGYYLGPQFRDMNRFQVLADHPAQIREHFDGEFPWDSYVPSFGTLTNIGQSRKPDTVHLFGVAMADVYTAIHYYKLKELFPCRGILSFNP